MPQTEKQKRDAAVSLVLSHFPKDDPFRNTPSHDYVSDLNNCKTAQDVEDLMYSYWNPAGEQANKTFLNSLHNIVKGYGADSITTHSNGMTATLVVPDATNPISSGVHTSTPGPASNVVGTSTVQKQLQL